jgi:hypothetical protein
MTDYPVAVNGLVKEIADLILDSAQRRYPTFAIATAMQCVAAAAMGTYLLPDGRPMCLYQMLLAPAAVGKGAYYNAANSLITAVSEQLIADEPGSKEGLRRMLLEWNARVFCIDEIQDFLAKMADDNPHLKGIGTDIKEIWSGVPKLRSVSIKTSVSPSIVRPLMGFFGTGTTNETAQYFSGSVAGGGLVSRFAVFVVENAGGLQQDPPAPDWSAISGKLYRIFHAGKTPEWKQRGFPDWYEYRKRLLDPKGCNPEGPQVNPTHKMIIEQDARDVLWEQRKLWAGSLEEDATCIEGAIFDRAATNALMYASIHAIGRASRIITMADVNVGIDLARISAESTVALATGYGGETAPDRDAKKILRCLEKNPQGLTKRELNRASRLTGKRFADALGGLISAQNVVLTIDKFYKT